MPGESKFTMENHPQKNPYHAPQHPAGPPAKPSGGMSTGWVIAIVMLVITAVCSCLCVPVLVALLLPAVQAAREAARTAESSNNLRQIGLAMHSYHTAHGTFPPAYIPDESGQPMTSWRTMILPHLEQQNLWDQYDMERPWDDPANAFLADIEVQVYASPRDTNHRLGMTNYVAVTGEGTIMTGDVRGEGSSFDDIRDGSSNTVMVVEILNSDIPWTEPRDLDMNNYVRVNDGGTWETPNVIPQRGIFLFGDGSVQVLDDTVTRETLELLFLCNDGQVPNLW